MISSIDMPIEFDNPIKNNNDNNDNGLCCRFVRKKFNCLMLFFVVLLLFLETVKLTLAKVDTNSLNQMIEVLKQMYKNSTLDVFQNSTIQQ
jgi:hypothetical protein